MQIIHWLLLDLSFYAKWYWWCLLAVLLIHAFHHFVGFHLRELTGLSREQLGKPYGDYLWFRAILGLIMLLTSGLVSVLAALVIMFVVMGILYVPIRVKAYGIIMQKADKNLEDLEDYVQPYLRGLTRLFRR